MNYGEIRTQFKAILNRRDCSDVLADTFLTQGLLMAQRDLRTPMQEVLDTETVAFPWTGWTVPTDFKRTIAMMYETSNGLTRIQYLPPERFLEVDNIENSSPIYFTRLEDKFQFRPTPAEDIELTHYYYGDLPAFTDDNSTTVLSTIAPDLVIYAGLSYAADYFLDDRFERFENRYVSIAEAVQQQAYEADGPGQVQPAYGGY